MWAEDEHSLTEEEAELKGGSDLLEGHGLGGPRPGPLTETTLRLDPVVERQTREPVSRGSE